MKMAAADRLTAIAFFAIGIAMLFGGWQMDRLEIRQIHPLSIPGLMPMLLGGALAFCAAILWLQADPESEAGSQRIMAGGSPVRLGLTVALTCIYALGLVGHVPFLWATALFIATFTAVFSWQPDADRAARLRILGQAALFGIVAAYAITQLFEKAFLVRLP